MGVTDAVGLGTNAYNLAQSVHSGDRSGIIQGGAGTMGAAMTALDHTKWGAGKGFGGAAGWMSTVGDGLNALDKFARGDVGGGITASGATAEDVTKKALNAAGPWGKVVAAGIDLGEGVVKAGNVLFPGLNAKENLGETLAQYATSAAKLGVPEMNREMYRQMINDPRAQSENVVVRKTGEATQTLGKAMQSADQLGQIGAAGVQYVEAKAGDTVRAAGQTANQLGTIAVAGVQYVGNKVGSAIDSAIPCHVCLNPFDEECKRTMWDCKKKFLFLQKSIKRRFAKSATAQH